MTYPVKFRSFITIRQPRIVADDEGGAPAATDAVIAQVWARVGSPSGRELKQGEQLRSEVDFAITIAKRTDLKANQQVVLPNGDVLEVLAFLNSDDDPRYSKLLCRHYKENRET